MDFRISRVPLEIVNSLSCVRSALQVFRLTEDAKLTESNTTAARASPVHANVERLNVAHQDVSGASMRFNGSNRSPMTGPHCAFFWSIARTVANSQNTIIEKKKMSVGKSSTPRVIRWKCERKLIEETALEKNAGVQARSEFCTRSR